MIEAMDHSFRPYGGEEMICRRCDFVIWAVADQGEAERAVKLLNGTWCREYMPDDWRALAAGSRRAETTGSVRSKPERREAQRPDTVTPSSQDTDQ